MALTAQRNYYDILGVPQNADDQDIRQAFRTLALRFHPDRSADPKARERFKEATEAYAVLSDPRKRAEYDAHGCTGESGPSRDDVWAEGELDDVLAALGISGSEADSAAVGRLLEHLLRQRGARGARGARGPARGADIEIPLTIPLDRVLTGGPEPVTIRRPGRCENCGGSGAKPGTEPITCPACQGSGRHVVSCRQRGITLQQITACPCCCGGGTVIDERCPHCGGLGEVERRDAITVQIPPGIDEGVSLRIPGYGAPSPDPGGPPGDACVVIHTVADPRFVRRGADLWCHEEITVLDAVLGAVRTIPALDGETSLTVPPGTQPGTVLRVAGQGLPRSGSTDRGDLRVSLIVRIPDRLDQAERQLYEQLRRIGSPPGDLGTGRPAL